MHDNLKFNTIISVDNMNFLIKNAGPSSRRF
jgi:hypothetical protein